MNNLFDISTVEVGVKTYGGLFVINQTQNKDIKLRIGHYCSIANGVSFILAGEHNRDTLSTFPYKAKVINPGSKEAGSKGNIIVQDDVWIGSNSTILSGVTIGQGAIVAAHSLVSKDVPPYAIVGGVPARIIKFRFSEEIISQLLTIDYSKLTTEKIIKNGDLLYEKITENNIMDIIKELEIKRE